VQKVLSPVRDLRVDVANALGLLARPLHARQRHLAIAVELRDFDLTLAKPILNIQVVANEC
jgi:hypothetical protein